MTLKKNLYAWNLEQKEQGPWTFGKIIGKDCCVSKPFFILVNYLFATTTRRLHYTAKNISESGK